MLKSKSTRKTGQCLGYDDYSGVDCSNETHLTSDDNCESVPDAEESILYFDECTVIGNCTDKTNECLEMVEGT